MMSANQYVTFHEPLGGPKKHHHRNRAPWFTRPQIIDLSPLYYGPVIDSIDDEIAALEARHDVVILGKRGQKPQLRDEVISRLKARGWVQSIRGDLVLLSPPGFVAALKGLGMIHGLGQFAGEPAIRPSEFVGLGVGGAMAITGIIIEGKVGLILGIVGGLVAAVAGGSALMRAMQPNPLAYPQIPPPPPGATPQQVAAYQAAVQQQQAGYTQGYAAGYPTGAQAQALPPPPPPPPKPTSSQRLQAAVSAYGPVAAELIKGVISLF